MPSFICSALIRGSFSRRDYTNNLITLAIAMTDHQKPQLLTYAQDDETILTFRMRRIVYHTSTGIIENRPCFIERNTMLCNVALVLRFIPLKSYRFHNYTIMLM